MSKSDRSTSSDPALWIDRHGDAMFAFAMIQLGDREAAEEMVQETFVAALGARQSFRGESSERTWLMGILKHKICDQFRRRRRERTTEDVDMAARAMENVFSETGQWCEAQVPWRVAPDDVAGQAEFWDALRQCLAGLPANMHDVFCLREFHGLSTEAICKVLDITPTNLWTMLHRARALLRPCLQRRWYGRSTESQK